MSIIAVMRILGLLMALFSATLLPPLLIALISNDGAANAFATALALILGTGLLIWLPVRKVQRDLRTRDGFIVVVLFWTVLSAVGALPFALSHDPHLSWTDAMFESVSGLTTTGATVITRLDELPVSILYYRQQLQWLGGMQLYRAEMPGPMKDTKLTPRITETAKALWYIYLGLTVACGLAYWLAGMSVFDAVGHAFSTVAIGGFSTHDASMGHFNSPLIDMIAVVFMLIAAANFALHFVAFRHRSVRHYWRDPELRFYLFLLGMVSLATVIGLWLTQTYDTWQDAVVNGVFQAVSIGTTTGFTTAEFYFWPPFVEILLLFASFVGGCAGSTGGGIKVIRMLLLVKQGLREITRLVHPNAQIPVRLGSRTVDSRVVEAVWGFFALYVASFTIMYLALAATGVELMTAFSAVAASINNLGPGLAGVGAHYADMHDPGKWILAFAMLLGRLEIFTLLVLLSPSFWRK